MSGYAEEENSNYLVNIHKNTIGKRFSTGGTAIRLSAFSEKCVKLRQKSEASLMLR